jgi:hypothetical protein
MKIPINVFTNYNCLFLLYNIYNIYNIYNNNNNNNNNIKLKQDLYAINACLTWSIFYTFHLSLLLDNNTFKKLRKKFMATFITFHCGNLCVHIFPYYYVLMNPPKNINFNHSLYALIIKFIWFFIFTKGSFDVSNIYIKYSNENLKKLYLISTITTLLSPYYYHYHYYYYYY